MFVARLFAGTPMSFGGPPGGYTNRKADTWKGVLSLLGVPPGQEREIRGCLIPVGPIGPSSVLDPAIPTNTPLVWAISFPN
ncbi:hypothetical protein ACFL11_00950 [Patescibacteria group bacterium]